MNHLPSSPHPPHSRTGREKEDGGGEEQGGEGRGTKTEGKERGGKEDVRGRGKKVREKERSKSKASGGRIKTSFGNFFTHSNIVLYI